MAVQSSETLLELARTQLNRLQQDDLDSFLAQEEDYAAACNAYAESAVGADDGRIMSELILMTTAISAELDRLKTATVDRLAYLNSRRRATSAYFDGSMPDSSATQRSA